MYFEIKHPLIQDKLTRMRNKETNSTTFRCNLQELTTLLAYEATDRKSTRLNSSHITRSRMPSSA